MGDKIREFQAWLPDEHWLPQILHPSRRLGISDVEYKSKKQMLKEYAQTYRMPNSLTDEPPLNSNNQTALQKFKEQVRQRTEKHPDTATHNPAEEIERYLSE